MTAQTLLPEKRDPTLKSQECGFHKFRKLIWLNIVISMTITCHVHSVWCLKWKLLCFYFFFFFQKKRKSQHPLLFKNQTKSKKDAHQVTRLGPDPLSRAFLHWHRGRFKHQKQLTSHWNELRKKWAHTCIFNFLPVRGNILLSDPECKGLCRAQLWPAHQELVPGPFISPEGPRRRECEDKNLQILSPAQIRETLLPGEISLKNSQIWLRKGKLGCWYWAIPMNKNYKMKTREGKSSASPVEAQLKIKTKETFHGNIKDGKSC